MKQRPQIRDESGVTLVELLVGMTASIVVLFALTTMIISTLHSSARISARVDATRNARLTITTIMEQLRSSCLAPRIAPVQEGSTGTSLIFVHQNGSDAVLNPVKSRIDLVNGTLTQYDYDSIGGAMPEWTYEKSPAARHLANGIAPISPGGAVFTYLAYANNAATLELTPPLDADEALQTVAVKVSFSASPGSGSSAGTPPAQVQDTALLRLTSLAFNQGTAGPCI